MTVLFESDFFGRPFLIWILLHVSRLILSLHWVARKIHRYTKHTL